MSTHLSPRRQTRRWLFLACLTLAAGAIAVARPLGAEAHTNSHARTAKAARAIPRSLSLAAARSTRADRALVTDAKALKRCLSRRPKQCGATRRAIQRAGSRLAAAKRQLAKAARSTGKAAGSATASRRSALQAPKLSASGQRLSWTRVDRVKSYVIEGKAPGQAAQFAVINGTSVKPPPVPGATVSYRVRTAVRGSSRSAAASIAFPAPAETVNTQAAPALSVSGQSLTWAQVGSVTTYVLMQRVPGQSAQYSAVSGSSFTPTPVPGATVHYSVRTAVDGSAWAPDVSITFPPATPTTPPVTTEGPTGTSESPASSFEIGLVPGSLANTEPGIISGLGARSVRMEAKIGTQPSTFVGRVEEYAKVGIRIMPLAGFEGALPTSEQAKSLASWAAEFVPGGTFWQGKSYPAGAAMTNIEFGNETSYTYQFSDNSPSAVASRAQTYAIRFKEAYEAIHAVNPNVGLLAQADDGDTGNSIWVENMFKAVPNLGQMVAGWTVHPYGPNWQTRIDALISQTRASGASDSIPIYVTEWGLATDNGRCLSDNYGWNKCMSYPEAATALDSTVKGMLARYGSRLRGFYLYQAQDLSSSGTSTDREQYFGAMQSNGAPKGAYTSEVASLLSQFQ